MEVQAIFQALFQDTQVRIFGTHDKPLFVANDMAEILDMKNIHKVISKFDRTKKVKCDIVDNHGRTQQTTVLTEKGLWHIIRYSRTINAEKIRQMINHKLGFMHSPMELDFINNIMKVFPDEIFETQKTVLGYRIDLYMPTYKLAIEYDEEHHRYQTAEDNIRQERIVEILGCTVLRVDYTDDIFAAAGRIYKHIRSHQPM